MADVPMPDLSHLTEEERRQIEQVLQRQKNEEEKDKEVVKTLAIEVKQIEQRVIQQKQQPFGGLMHDPNKEGLCEICQKVKFADGIGHQCNHCHLHSCQRCGGRVPIKNGKFIWVCTLCKKKQELLKKTGQWYHGKPEELLSDSNTASPLPLSQQNGPHNGGLLQQTSSSSLTRPQAPLRRQMSHDPNQQQQHRQEQRLTQLQRQQSLRRRETVDQPHVHDEDRRREASMRRRGSVIENTKREPSRTAPGEAQARQLPGDYSQNQRGLPRRPDSQGGSRRGGYEEQQRAGDYPNRRRTQSNDRYGQEEYAGDYDPRRGAGAYVVYAERSGFGGAQPQHPSQGNSRRHTNPEERRRAYQQNSYSSSDEELRSNFSDFTDCSVRSYSSEYSTRTHPGLRHLDRPNRGRLGRMSSQQEPDYYLHGYGESSRSSNVTWQPTTDGRRLIGHMILRKSNGDAMESRNSATTLGLKVEGGKMTPSGRIAAFITRVKHGSVADVIGNLRQGDEVLEWNAIPLRSLNFQEVYDIIADSRDDPDVELMVSRKATDRYGHHEAYGHPHLNITAAPHHLRQPDRPPPGIRRGMKPAAVSETPYTNGRIQLSFIYWHEKAELAVSVIQGAELVPPDGSYRNTYVELYLLPHRSEQTKRRTKIKAKTNDPQWNQTFYYAPLKESELYDLTLQIQVWDTDRYKSTSSEFVGEALVELASVPIHDEPRWFYLTYPDTGLENRHAPPLGYVDPDFISMTSGDGLSPAGSSTSRLSDMEYASDADLLEAVDRRRQRGPSTGHGRFNPGTSSTRSRYVTGAAVDPARFSDRDRDSPQSYRDRIGGGTDRRGRRDMHGVPEDELRQQRSTRRSTHSAPPVSEDPFYFEDMEGSPTGSRASSVASTRKRQLPILPPLGSTLSPHLQTQSNSRRPSLTTILVSEIPYDPHMTMLPSAPLSPSAHSRHSQSRDRDKPIMQLHNSTLTVPGAEDGNPVLTPSSHPPKLDQLLKNSSQEENIDPRDRVIQRTAEENNSSSNDQSESVMNTRHSRGISRRSRSERSGSTALSRSSEPTGGQLENELTLLVPDNRSRKLSESLPRFESMDVDDTASQSNLLQTKSISTSDVKKPFDFEEYLLKNQQLTGKDRGKNVSAKAAAILGLKKDGKRPTFTRSEEVGHQSPASIRAAMMTKQMSKDSTDGSVSSSGHGRNHLTAGDPNHLSSFVEGLGPGQVVGRQVLASPCLGEIQLNIKYHKGRLEVEIIRAKGLIPKTGTRTLPATYVKVYLMEDKKSVAKAKTTIVRRSLDPLYQQQLVFNEYVERRSLQISVWGDYGRMEKKLFLGVALISLDDLDLSSIVIGWYKLFNSSTLITPAAKNPYQGSGSQNNSVDQRSGVKA